MKKSLRKWLSSNLTILLIISVFFLISSIKLAHPGVNNDQLMFVNAATFRPDNLFLWKSFHNFPTMIFPYIGALKTYIYMPIFYFFGVSIYSIRFPQIILMAISLFIVYQFLKLAFNKKIALLSVLLLSLDPSLIAHSRVDVGPVVLEFLLKTLAIYLLFLYLSKGKVVYFLCIFPILALGIFNKLNFLWFVNAFFISFVVIYGKDFFNRFKKEGKIVPILLLFLPYLFLLKFALKISKEVTANYKNFTNEISFTNIFSNFSITADYLITLINGNQFFKMIYGFNPTILGGFFSLVFLLTLIGGFGYFFIRRKKLGQAIYFFLLLTILILGQVLLTKRATNPWHAFSVYPFLTILFILITSKIKDQFNLKQIALNLLIFFIIAYQLLVNFQYISNYSKPTRLISYSSGIYEMISYIKPKPEHVICLDVDICNQLLSLTQQSYKYYEPFPFLNPESYEKSFDELKARLNSGTHLYVSHGDSNSHFPKIKKDFFNYLLRENIKYSKDKEFIEGGKVIFEVYSFSF